MNLIILLLFFSLLAFILRILPVFFLTDTGFIHIIRGDAEFNFRQIEVMANNFLQYDWFDPMTAYPNGKNIGWGPLFPMIAGAFAIICGAVGQTDIINIVSFVPPLMAAGMVPIVYFIAKTVGKSRLTGIVAAAITSVISLFFLNYTSYGYVDHQAAEILFSSLFCLFYILASGINPAEKFIPCLKDKNFLKPFLYSVIAGFFYCACYFTSPTTVLFLVIISVYTFISCIFSHNLGVTPIREGFVNTVALIIPAVFILIFGVKYDGFVLSSYTIIHAIIPVLIIAATWIMIIISNGLSRTQFKENKFAYPGIILITGMLSGVLASFLLPEIFTNLFSGANLIFGFENAAIAEMQPWSLDYALQSYHFAFILVFGGIIIALKNVISKKERGSLFILIWALITLYITIKHLRFEFFVAVPFAVLSAFCISYAYTNFFRDFSLYLKKDEKRSLKSKKVKATVVKKNPTGAAIFAFIAIITVLFFVNSLISDVNFASDYSGVSFEKSKWIESMEWMNENTPSPGVDYFGEYSSDTFTYPDNSYGVMAWWDFGHVITLIGKRIPVSNPFQDNVAGDMGCADFLIAEFEDAANRIMDNANAKFVITNSELTTPDKGILTILSWLNQADIVNDYLIYINMPDDSGNYANTICYTPDYYNSMIVKLENLDGTYIKPTEADVLTTKTVSGVKSVVSYDTMDYDKAVLEAVSDDKMLISTDPDEPCCIVPALKNYRLVYESPDPDDNVKIFEYVRGFEVLGEGTVQVNIVTNTGREFVYTQKSENGKFVLPYSTLGNQYGVKAKGRYHILETDEYFDVSEEDIGKVY